MGIILPAGEPTPYKVIETTDEQKLHENGIDSFPSSETAKSIVKRIEIEEGVTTIRSQMFSDFHSLVSVKLPSTLKRIGEYSFSFCTSLEEIIIPEGVELIRWDAFTGCRSLKNVRLPSTLKVIIKTKKYDDEDVDFSQEERFDLAYTVWEQTSQREALDYLNAHGREFFLYAVNNHIGRTSV